MNTVQMLNHLLICSNIFQNFIWTNGWLWHLVIKQDHLISTFQSQTQCVKWMNIKKKEKALSSPDIQLYHQDYIVEHQRIERWDLFNQDSQVDNTFLFIMNCTLCSKSTKIAKLTIAFSLSWIAYFVPSHVVWKLNLGHIILLYNI